MLIIKLSGFVMLSILVLSFAENEFSWKCVELWLTMFYQETWECNFLLDKFPFEVVKCELEMYLQEPQKWNSQRLEVEVPVMRHLPYLVSSP